MSAVDKDGDGDEPEEGRPEAGPPSEDRGPSKGDESATIPGPPQIPVTGESALSRRLRRAKEAHAARTVRDAGRVPNRIEIKAAPVALTVPKLTPPRLSPLPSSAAVSTLMPPKVEGRRVTPPKVEGRRVTPPKVVLPPPSVSESEEAAQREEEARREEEAQREQAAQREEAARREEEAQREEEAPPRLPYIVTRIAGAASKAVQSEASVSLEGVPVLILDHGSEPLETEAEVTALEPSQPLRQPPKAHAREAGVDQKPDVAPSLPPPPPPPRSLAAKIAVARAKRAIDTASKRAIDTASKRAIDTTSKRAIDTASDALPDSGQPPVPKLPVRVAEPSPSLENRSTEGPSAEVLSTQKRGRKERLDLRARLKRRGGRAGDSGVAPVDVATPSDETPAPRFAFAGTSVLSLDAKTAVSSEIKLRVSLPEVVETLPPSDALERQPNTETLEAYGRGPAISEGLVVVFAFVTVVIAATAILYAIGPSLEIEGLGFGAASMVTR